MPPHEYLIYFEDHLKMSMGYYLHLADMKAIEEKEQKEETVTNTEWMKYRHEVRRLTELQDLSIIPNYNKIGWKDHHVDHIVSIYNGYKLNIPPEAIADISNLRMIPSKENLRKGIKSPLQSLSSVINRVHPKGQIKLRL